MRNRLEDLGKISILVETLMENKLFILFDCRTKDSLEFFRNLTIQEQDELIKSLADSIENVQLVLYRIQEIAEGTAPTDDGYFKYSEYTD